MRESFLIYKSFYDPIKNLSNEKLGELFRCIFDYQIEKKECEYQDVKMAFEFFKNQFRLDEEKYQKVCEARKHSGSIGGKQKVANASKCKQKVAKLADNENENEKDNDKEQKKTIQYDDRFLKIWDYYQIGGQKGDKASAWKSYDKCKIGSKTSEEIKAVLDYEMVKTYGQRHLSTLLNNFDITLEATKEISPTLERTGYEY